MTTEEGLESFLDIVVREGLYSNRRRLKFYLDYLFAHTRFAQMTMLDVGGGVGLFSFYAAAMGADKVICLEPEAAGSRRGGTMEVFQRLQTALPFGNKVSLYPITLQEFDADGCQYHTILLHDSINHLDEDFCAKLPNEPAAIQVYRDLCRKLAKLSRQDATLIMTDASRYNFYYSIGLRNPFAPQIEWEKHQAPECWIELLSQEGFCNAHIRWSTFNRLGNIGNLILGHKYIAFFLKSHFCLTMKRS